MDILKGAATEITQNHAIDHYTADVQAEHDAAQAAAVAEWEAAQKKASVEEEEDWDDDALLNDPALNTLEEARMNALKARYAKEKEAFAAGTGEYREITEEEFLKEVCNFENVVVHFYHREFFRCKIVDKHMRILAPKYRNCKFLCLDAEKA